MTIEDDMRELDPKSFIQDTKAGSMNMRKRITVGILGATGSVGQQLIRLLAKHPWFDIQTLAASDASSGKMYKDVCFWRMNEALPEDIGNMVMKKAHPDGFNCDLVFSALDGQVAKEIESSFAQKGYPVISTTRAHRMDPDVPLVIPEVNADHLELVKVQKFSDKGFIVAKPNCSVVGLAMPLKPLQLEFGIDAVHVVTMQAASGAGFPGVPSSALLDNIIPYIPTEEDRIIEEPIKILGSLNQSHIVGYPIKVSATATRVPVTDGHLQVVSVKLKEKATLAQVERAFQEFVPNTQELALPTGCSKALHYLKEEGFPQPKLHRDLERGMAVSVGRLRECPLLDYKFVTLSHNTIRGAAGGAILIAEVLIKRGYVFW